MANWQHRVKIKHLLTESEDHKSVQASMNAIHAVISKDSWFNRFTSMAKFRKIPKGNDVLGPVDYANRLLNRLYDYADANLIWID